MSKQILYMGASYLRPGDVVLEVRPGGSIRVERTVPDHPMWTHLSTRGGVDEPPQHAILTPWGWLGIHPREGSADELGRYPQVYFAAEGWEPPASYSVGC